MGHLEKFVNKGSFRDVGLFWLHDYVKPGL